MNKDQPVPEQSTPGEGQYFRKVQWRIMACQLPLLLVLFFCLLFWLEGHLRDTLLSFNADLARQSGQLAVSAVRSSMLSQDSHQPWEWVEQTLSMKSTTRLTVVDGEGRVLHSSNRKLLGHRYRLTDHACIPCHAGGSPRAVEQAALIEGPRGSEFSVFAAPLRNTGECRGCHADEGLNLGMVSVERSLWPVQQLIRTTRIGLIIAGILAWALTFYSARFVLGRYLYRPLRQLVQRARALGSGDPVSTLELPERSEFSVLANAFNESSKQMREGIREIFDQRDALRTLYFIADQLSESIDPEERRRRAVELVGTIFESDCLLITGYTQPETQEFHGTLTYRDSGREIRELTIGVNTPLPDISFFAPDIFTRWLQGDLDGQFRVIDKDMVAYPLERHGRRLGLTMAPARQLSASSDGRATAARPEVVMAFLKHLVIALELSELQREYGRQERLAAIGDTVAGLSHCMKNTLNGLRGGLYVVERAMENKNEERLEQGWRVLRNSIQQIERLSLDMLYFVGERKPRPERVDVNQILEEIVDLLSESTAHQGVNLYLDLDSKLGPQLLDRLAVFRAVLNLVTNAVDACYESEEGDRVTLRSRLTETELVISIEDNGVGMSELTRQRLFERYFSTKSARGTGLGLPVVRKIMDELGGHVAVESVRGEGSTFYLHFKKRDA